MTNDSPGLEPRLADLELGDRLVVQQLFRPMLNEYRISAPAPGTTDEGTPLLYATQKRLKIKEDIRFRLSPEDERHLFMIKSKTVFEFRGRHEVVDADGAVLGLLEKDFGGSLLRSHWRVRDAAGMELFEAFEASWVIAIVRRVVEWLSDWSILAAFIPFNFVLHKDGRELGRFVRVLGKLRDRYVLELNADAGDIDRRLLVAFAVGLDALQDR